jgi:transketolase
MRDAFIRSLYQACERNPDIVLITGDLGFGVFDDFRERFPDQFMNLGVAEQNMAGVGAGMAMAGHTVFTYSIANFPILRCLEQIRNDICYHDADVKIVSVGGGMSYGALGPSHFATEDLGILRMLPNLTVVAPGDPVEMERLMPQIVAHKGPLYLRLGRAGEARVTPEDAEVRLGTPNAFSDRGDVLLLTAGGMLEVGVACREALEAEGVGVALASVHTLKPFDEAWLASRLANHRLVVTLEEHARSGGLGGVVAESMAGRGAPPALLRLGLESVFPDIVGSQEYLRARLGLDADGVCGRIRAALG